MSPFEIPLTIKAAWVSTFSFAKTKLHVTMLETFMPKIMPTVRVVVIPIVPK